MSILTISDVQEAVEQDIDGVIIDHTNKRYRVTGQVDVDDLPDVGGYHAFELSDGF